MTPSATTSSITDPAIPSTSDRPEEAEPATERRRRRTQRERSNETRAILLDATIECLGERGYAGTTAREVAARAGLSRGAQLHHFGTKTQLVTAAVERLFERRLAEFKRALLPKAGAVPSIGDAIDLLWALLSGTTGYAYMELVWAARTDPELRQAVVELNRQLDTRVDAAFRELFQDVPEPWAELGWTAVFAILEGLAFEKIVRQEDDRVDRLIPLLKQAASFAARTPSALEARFPKLGSREAS